METIYVQIPVNTCHGWELQRAKIDHLSQGSIELRLVQGGVEVYKPRELASVVDAFATI